MIKSNTADAQPKPTTGRTTVLPYVLRDLQDRAEVGVQFGYEQADSYRVSAARIGKRWRFSGWHKSERVAA